MTLPEPASRHALALLRFPDRRTAWVVLLAATVDVPSGLDRRLAELHGAVPMVGARLHDEVWHPGDAPPIQLTPGDPLAAAGLQQPFDLAVDPPLRVLVDDTGTRIALAGHHAAFDGLALVALLTYLLGGPPVAPVDSPPAGHRAGIWPLLRRLALPADRVPPSPERPPADSLATQPIDVRGKDVTARLAAACSGAASRRAGALGARFRRVGVTLAVGGPAGIGNVASYRRIDVPAGGSVGSAAKAALALPLEPAEQVKAPRAMRLLAPISERFSDSILVSNLGRHQVPSASSLEFFPVARGRSAVAFGAAGLESGAATLSVRARDLAPDAAAELLADAVAAFEADGTGR